MKGKGRWTFDDWHHKECNEYCCKKSFCRDHRRIFWECQDFEVDNSTGFFGGDGECVKCYIPAEVLIAISQGRKSV